MISAAFKPGTRVLFKGLFATVTPLPKEYLSLVFDDNSTTPITLSPEQADSFFEESLRIISGPQAAPKFTNFSITDRIELERRSYYIDELQRVSKGGGPGGVKLRETAIHHVRSLLGDTKGVSPAQLARWHKKAIEHPQGVIATIARLVRNQ